MEDLIFHGYREITAPAQPAAAPQGRPVPSFSPIEFREGTIDRALQHMNPGSMLYRVLDDLSRRRMRP